MKIPFFTSNYTDARYGEELRARIDQVIKSGIFILGDEVKELESRITAYSGIKHAIGVANGSDALYLGLQALELPEGSEVITTPFTFFASVSSITRNGLTPRFVDVTREEFNLDPAKVEAAITPQTSAILPVDLFTQTPDFDKIVEIANRDNLKIVEDSAEAFGMQWRGKSAGGLGDIGVYSFFPTKTLGCFGDGGMVLTDNDELAAKVRRLRVHGAEKKYHHSEIGLNSRLDALQAAILNVKMNYIESEIEERARIASWYKEELEELSTVELPPVKEGCRPVWYVFNIKCQKRDELQNHLKEAGIGTSIYYPLPMHLQECFRYLGYEKGDFPVAEALCREVLALPLFVGMEREQVSYVCDKIKEFYKGGA